MGSDGPNIIGPCVLDGLMLIAVIIMVMLVMPNTIHTWYLCSRLKAKHAVGLHSQFSQLLGKCMHAKFLQSCPTLCDPMNCRLLGSSVHGILQARILEWIATFFSRGSSQPRERTCLSYVLCLSRCVLSY